MEENKELETVTESQRNAGKGLFLSGIIVGFAATLLVVGASLSLSRSIVSLP
mgnify:CR=1 FL=1